MSNKPQNAKYDVKIFEKVFNPETGKESVQLCTDLIVPGYVKKNGEVEPDKLLPRFSFVEFREEPSEAQLIEAENTHRDGGAYLKKVAAEWGQFGTNATKGKKLLKECIVRAKKDFK